MAIKSFNDGETRRVFDREFSRKLPQSIQRVARVRLNQIDLALTLADLAIPGLQLEALKRSRKGQHSLRINRQWRVCFQWNDGDANKVEITDYH